MEPLQPSLQDGSRKRERTKTRNKDEEEDSSGAGEYRFNTDPFSMLSPGHRHPALADKEPVAAGQPISVSRFLRGGAIA